MPDRKKPGVAFWATLVVLAVLVAYPLAYGPWLGYGDKVPRLLKPALGVAFSPLHALYHGGSAPAPYKRYLDRWTDISIDRHFDQIEDKQELRRTLKPD